MEEVPHSFTLMSKHETLFSRGMRAILAAVNTVSVSVSFVFHMCVCVCSLCESGRLHWVFVICGFVCGVNVCIHVCMYIHVYG